MFEYQDVCAFSFSDLPLPARVAPFVINTGSANPISQRYFCLPPQVEEHLRDELNKMLPWVYNIIVVAPGQPLCLLYLSHVSKMYIAQWPISEV